MKSVRGSTRDALIRELANRGMSAALGQLLLVGVIAWFTGRLGIPSLAIILSNLVRMYLVSRPRLRFQLFSALVLVSAVAWGILCMQMIQEHGVNHIFSYLTILTMAGITAASATSLSPAPWLFLAFVALALGIPFGYLISIPHATAENGIPTLFACFAFFMASHVRIHFNETLRSIRHNRIILRERDRLQTVLNTFPGFVSCIDEHSRYEFASKGYTKTFGAEPEIGKNVGYSGHDPDFKQVIHDFMAGEEREKSVEHMIQTIHGSRKFLMCLRKFDVLSARSRPGAILVSLDVHDRHQAQVQLEEERARSAFAAKMALLGEMAGGIAHEINNPLAVISGHADHIRMRLETGRIDPTQVLYSAEKIKAMVGRIGKIVRGLRTFARSDDSDPKTLTSIRSIIEDTLELCSEKLKHSRIELRVAPVPEDLAIECSPTQISQVLLNLISNAKDAVEPLEEKWIELSVSEAGGSVRICVTDSGFGIPKEIRERILFPFFTTKPVGKGTGLGLSISKGICESHQGSLSIDPESERTRFIVSLPVAPGKPAATAA